MTVGRSASEKSDKMTWHFEWMPHQEKFSKKSLRPFSLWNQMWEWVESEEDDLEWRGFWDGVDLHLSAMMQTNRERERERERERSRKAQTQLISKDRKRKVRMHEKCMNMWHAII